MLNERLLHLHLIFITTMPCRLLKYLLLDGGKPLSEAMRPLEVLGAKKKEEGSGKCVRGISGCLTRLMKLGKFPPNHHHEKRQNAQPWRHFPRRRFEVSGIRRIYNYRLF